MKNPTKSENLLAESSNVPLDTATLELLAKWKAEDATTDPNTIQAAERELAEFKKSMNAIYGVYMPKIATEVEPA